MEDYEERKERASVESSPVICVQVGTRLYVGRENTKCPDKELLELRDAFELVVQHRLDPRGTVQTTILPTTIAPFQDKAAIWIPRGIAVLLGPVDDVPGMHDVIRAMDGKPTLIRPDLLNTIERLREKP